MSGAPAGVVRYLVRLGARETWLDVGSCGHADALPVRRDRIRDVVLCYLCLDREVEQS